MSKRFLSITLAALALCFFASSCVKEQGFENKVKDIIDIQLKTLNNEVDSLIKVQGYLADDVKTIKEDVTDLEDRYTELSGSLDDMKLELQKDREWTVLQLDTVGMKIDSLGDVQEAFMEDVYIRLGKLENRIQKIDVVPQYSDGSVEVGKKNNNVVSFLVRPESVAQMIAAAHPTGDSTFKFLAAKVLTKASVTFDTLEIQSVTFADGILSVTVSGKKLDSLFFVGKQPYSACLVINDRNSEATSGFFPLTPDDGSIKITAEDDWYKMLKEDAKDGDVFRFMPGNYNAYVIEGGEPFTFINLTKNISIKAADPINKPVLKGFSFKLYGVSFDISNIILDGNQINDHTFDYKSTGDIDHLRISGCEICNFQKAFLYVNVSLSINDISINNCIIHDIGNTTNELFDCRKAGYDKLCLRNSTIYNSAQSRNVFRFDDCSSTTPASAQTVIDHCSFSDVGNSGESVCFLYIRFKGNSNIFTNNIVAGFNNKRGFSTQASTSVPTFENNYYFNCKNLQSLDPGNTENIRFFDTKGTTLSSTPFRDAANYDFTIVNGDVARSGAGDPRWIPVGR